MSGRYEPDCDFVVVRRVDGMCRLEEWKMSGRLERAMRDVVADVMDGEVEDASLAEFALGVVAAIDMIGHGRLRLKDARGRFGLWEAIEKAYRSTTVANVDTSMSTVFSDACAELSGKGRKSRKGSR